jgi:2,3-dihydroxybiphenyl 1,2-dioxygenase
MIRNLAYVGFRSPKFDEWRSFGPEVLGAELAPDGPDGAVRLRVDDATWRVSIHPGEADDLAYLGWEVDDLEATRRSIEAAGVSLEEDPVAAFTDPFGFRHQLVTGIAPGPPFRPGREMAGFVTGDQGLGHVVLIVPDLAAAEAFYTDAMGFRVSDSIDSALSLCFFHCPGRAARHHSLAVASVPGMVGMHHLMLETQTMDDVGGALDVVNERQIPLPMGLGRHSNDLMTSFYMRTPSGFEIEYGTGGRTVDDNTWETATYDTGSLWGHKPPASGAPRPKILRPYQLTEAST